MIIFNDIITFLFERENHLGYTSANIFHSENYYLIKLYKFIHIVLKICCTEMRLIRTP